MILRFHAKLVLQNPVSAIVKQVAQDDEINVLNASIHDEPEVDVTEELISKSVADLIKSSNDAQSKVDALLPEDVWLHKNLMAINDFTVEKSLATVNFLNLAQNEILKVIHTDQSIVQWAKRTNEVDSDRYEWHLKRACGFGGSDVGAIKAQYIGEKDQFSSAFDVISSKLLMTTPFRPFAAMEIGVALEDSARKAFRKHLVDASDTGVKIYENDAVINILGSVPSEPILKDHPWAGYSPDDILVVEFPDGKKISMMVDYKVKQDVFDGNVLERYKDQVMYGTWIVNELAKNNDAIIPIDKDEIFVATYAPDPVTNQFKINIVNIPYDQDRVDLIVEACDASWDLRQQGVLPQVAQRTLISADSFVQQEQSWTQVSNKLAAVLAQSSVLSKIEDDLKSQISVMVNNHHLGDEATLIGKATKTTLKASLNSSAIIEKLLSDPSVSQKDIDGCAKLGSIDEVKILELLKTVFPSEEMAKSVLDNTRKIDGVDPIKLAQLLEKTGNNPEQYLQYSGRGCSTGLIRTKNPVVADLKSSADVMVGHTVKDLEQILDLAPNISNDNDNEGAKSQKKRVSKKDRISSVTP